MKRIKKNVSHRISDGRTMQTRDEYLEEKSSIVKVLNDDEIKKYDYLKWWNWQ